MLHKVKYLCKWLPILWRNVSPWDYSHLLSIMIAKLEEMEDAFRSDKAMTESSKQHALEMQQFRLALESLLNNPDCEADFAGDAFKNVIAWWD